MKKRRLWIFFSGAIALLCCSFQCNRDFEPIPQKYAFKTSINIYPLKRTYTLADTVWLEADINGKILYDTISRQYITTDSAALTVNATYTQLAATNTNPADGLCQILTPDVSNTHRQSGKGVVFASFGNYGCGRSSLKWRIGIKPNYKGTYGLFLFSGGNLQTCQTTTTTVPFYSSHQYQFATGNLNQDIYTNLPDSARRNDSYAASSFTSGIASRSVFFIKVE